MSGILIPDIRRSCLGEKQTTRQAPCTGAAARSGEDPFSRETVISVSAGKSLLKTNVDVYRGFSAPPARRLPGQR
jgi:hypothetical protein